ncbi:MAG: archaellin/type IV pilin N-terminal domain-containing protein [Dehalococcoidia bacterium]
MLKRLYNMVHRDERGITGLETAIILIAFVVVASVFAYTVLSAGIFSSQKGQEAIYAGLEETRASMGIRGSVLGYSGNITGGNTTLVSVAFTLTNTLEGQAIDMTAPYVNTGTSVAPILAASGNQNVAIIAFIDENQLISDAAWTLTFVGKNNGDSLLESEEKAVITVWLFNNTGGSNSTFTRGSGSSDPWIDSAAYDPAIYNTFTVEVRPETGASLNIQRTLPGRLDSVMSLN